MVPSQGFLNCKAFLFLSPTSCFCNSYAPPSGHNTLLQTEIKHPYHSINRKKLISSLESPMSISNSTWNYSRNIDWRVLFFSSHNIESKALFCFRQLNNSRMRVSFTGSKCSNSSLKENFTYLKV